MRSRIIYGPILSKRLGRSLGVDAIKVAGRKKNCNFDCVYCQLGSVDYRVNAPETVEGAVTVDEVVESLRQYHRNIDDLDYITFSGTCEPTLNLGLGEIIRGVREISDKPICVITNSSLMGRADVRSNLAEADLVVATLVSGNEDTFRAIHRPVDGVSFEDIVKGLQMFSSEAKKTKLSIEVMLMDSTNDYPVNCTEQEIKGLVDVLKTIDPDEIEILTVSRPPAEDFIVPVADPRLKEIAHIFDEEFGRDRVRFVLKGLKKDRSKMKHENVEEEVYDLILRRPCTFDQICASLGIESAELQSVIGKLLSLKSIICVASDNGNYYKVA
ncbi:MAG: radical SAM protein [Methanosarcinaceae archaeon]|nr:radical SAM protein [Methanosarcinaceae archaeon]